MMGLQGIALEVALDVKAKFPEVKFTSGKRTIAEQALAMVANVKKNPKWIEQTYAQTRIVVECQDWVDRHAKADQSAMASAFATIISLFSPEEQRRLSRHLTGEAFDMEPIVGGNAEKVIDVLRDWAQRKAGRFLTSEGGLVIWHWQAK